MSSLKKQAIRGTVWTIGGFGASQVLRFASNLILTRLLLPEMFGLIALVYVFITGLHLFSDIGLGPSIIQNKRGDDPTFLNTAWTMQVIRAIGLWFISFLIAWPIATFYKEPQLLWLIPIVGSVSFIDGFQSTATATLSRHLAIGKLTIFEFVLQLFSTAVMLLWAWFHPSVVALVVGNIAQAVVRTVWSHRLVPGQSNRFAWERESVKEIFSFGKWIFFSTMMTFLAGQADKLILGKLFTFTLLGVYNIAFTLADIPRQVILRIGSAVIFPVISKQADLPRQELRAKILQKRWLLLLGSAVVLVIPVSFGDLFISVLYDNRYADARWMMPILAVGLWHTLLYSTMSPALLAIGKPIYGSYGYLLTFLNISIVLPIGFSLNGKLGAMIVLALSDLPLYGAVMYGLWREKLSCVQQDIKATAVFLGLLTLVLMGRFTLGFGFPLDAILSR